MTEMYVGDNDPLPHESLSITRSIASALRALILTILSALAAGAYFGEPRRLVEGSDDVFT